MARSKTEDFYPSQIIKLLEGAIKKPKGDCPFYEFLRFDFTAGRKDSQGRVEYGDIVLRSNDKWIVPRIRIANLETQCSMKVNQFGSRNLMFKSNQTYKTKVKEGDDVVEKIEPIGAALVLLTKAMIAVFDHMKANDLLSVDVATKSFTNFMQTAVKAPGGGSKKNKLPESEWSLRIEMPFESETKKVRNADGKMVDKKVSANDAPLKGMIIKDLRRFVHKNRATKDNIYEDAGVENADNTFDPIVFGNVDQFLYYGSKCSGLIEISASCSGMGFSVKPKISKLLVLPAPPNVQTSDADAAGDMILDTEDFVPKGATLIKSGKPAATKPALHAFGDDDDLDGNDSEPEPPKKSKKPAKVATPPDSDDEDAKPPKKAVKKPAKVATPPDSDEDAKPTKKPVKKPAKVATPPDSDDEDAKPAKKPVKKPAKVTTPPDSDNDTKPAKKPVKKPTKVATPPDSDDDAKPAKKPVKKPAKVATPPDSDNDTKPAKKPVKKPAKVATPPDSDDEPPKKPAKKAAVDSDSE